MTMHNYAENSKFGDLIKKMRGGEVNGSGLYFVLIYLAREKGYHDLAEAMIKNACEGMPYYQLRPAIGERQFYVLRQLFFIELDSRIDE